MKHPRITVVTIAYNSVATIEKTISSVVSQDYANKEYIVVDGGSDDGTQSVVERYRPSIDVFISEKDKGRSDAFNKGIRHSTGDLIVMINSDDYMLPGVLSRVADMYEESTDIFCGNLILWNESTGYKCRIKPSLEFPKMPFFCRPAHQGMFISRRLYNQLGGYDINVAYAMDLDFLMRATSAGARFKYMNFDIAVFRLGGATSDSIFRKRKEYLYILKKNGASAFQAWIFYLFLVVTQTTKKILRLSGFDVVRMLRYKKTK